MKLFYAPTSPYVRKVMIVLEETGQLDDVELVNVATTPIAADSAILAKTRLRKYPRLSGQMGQRFMTVG
jgi:glutathione S-transferase